MTHSLSIPSAVGRAPLLQMQFSAPLRTAEAFGFEPADALDWSGQPRSSEPEAGFVLSRSHRVTLALLAVAWGAVALWLFA